MEESKRPRLSKIMSQRGLCSRREADVWIQKGWVFVNGEQVRELGTRVDEDVTIELAPEARADAASKRTILINKPLGYVSSQPEGRYPAAVDLVRPDRHWPEPLTTAIKGHDLMGLAPAGRLDINSTGLLVMTQDGALARQLIGSDEIDKEYLVRVKGELTDERLEKLRYGLHLDGKQLRRTQVDVLEKDGLLRMTLREGKKRQIRRMCEQIDLEVVSLKRVRIGKVRLGNLPTGRWRYLRADETF